MKTAVQTVYRLGESIRTHSLLDAYKRSNILTVILYFCLGPVVYFTLTIFLSAFGGKMPWLANRADYLTYLPIFISLIMIYLGVTRLVMLIYDWPLSVTLYEYGLEYTDHTGTRIILWDSVDGIWQRTSKRYRYGIIPDGTSYWCAVRTRGGETLIFDDKFSNITELVETLQILFAATQLPKYKYNLQYGKQVEFGPISLDRAGFYQGHKQLPLDKVDRIEINNGILSIKKKGSKFGSWCRIKTFDIPNFAVFYALIKQYGIIE